ncbi:T6SS immunity protein Tli4 family protein [Xanthomonas oryzae]|uniref:T6SS immunity protein Tli4 family protein n=1 Tax=Xanthomonas oryzae TaxID=347 RepID=UPI000ADC5471|nr:T6SS immunity protein Tli4 family protein [Xanthomonas oryzae]
MIIRHAMCGVLALLALTGCGRQGPHQDKDYAAMNTIVMKPVCIGRFELSIPRDGGRDWRTDLDWAEVTRLPFNLRTTEDFWGYVEARKQFLQSQKHDTEPSLLSLYEKVGDNAVILLNRQEPSNDVVYYLERYVWLGDRGYFFKGLGEGDEIKTKLEGYKKILGRLVPHDGLERPVTNGYCINGATITGVIDDIDSFLSIEIRKWKASSLFIGTGELLNQSKSADTPGVDLRSFTASGSLAINRERFEAEKSNDPGAPKSFEVLRQRGRDVAGAAGDEAVWRITYNNNAVNYRFLWKKAHTAPNTSTNPSLTLDLDVGDETLLQEQLPSDSELFSLWDATLESVKLRN